MDQASGVSALVLFGAPSLVASFVIARWSELALVADLAAAFGLTATVFTAASFNLAQALALWGVRDHVDEDFWLNRVTGSTVGAVLALSILLLAHVDARIALLAVLVKLTDAGADLRLGFDTLQHDLHFGMSRLLRWSIQRIAVFGVTTAIALAIHEDGVDALLWGAIVQLCCMQVWRAIPRVGVTRERLAAAIRLGRLTAHLSVATTMCALLVTTPRLVSKYICSKRELGLYGITFMATTFIGMSFNLSWYRMASTTRQHGVEVALRHYLREGSLLAVALAASLVVSAPLVARIYAIADVRFYRIFIVVGVGFVIFYFFLCLANMLKTSSFRLLEASAYLTAAVVLAGLTLPTRSLLTGMLCASGVLAIFVVLGVSGARRVVVG